MKVLVTYATKSGATAGIAEAIAEELRRMGLDAEVLPVDEVRDVRPYDAVILGSAIYMGRWRREAIRFGKRNEALLRERPVWLFGSGPTDRSAEEREIPPVPGAAELASRIGARGHVTFGGRLTAETAGWFARSIIEKSKAGVFGDFRNFDRIRMWAHDVGVTIGKRQLPPLSA